MSDIQGKTIYKAFGFSIKSEIHLPEISQLNHGADLIDIVIEKGDLQQVWQERAKEGQYFYIEKDILMFRILQFAIFSVESGKRITVSPLPEYDEDVVRLYILGTCMGAILMQRKILPLHGSVMAIDGKAYAVVGESGAGKSTLAAALLQKGYGMLTDDVIAVDFKEDGTPFVIPSYPQQKLWQESLDHFDMDSGNYQSLIDREEKFAVPVRERFVHEPLELGGVFELVKGDYEETRIEPVKSLEKIFKLLQHTYRHFFLPGAGLTDWHFQTTSKLAGKVNIYQLQRPVDRFTAYELVELMLETIKQGEDVHV